MRSATASVAAVIVLALGISMFWPEAGDPGGKLVAQPPAGESKKRENRPAKPKEPTLEEKLNQRIDFGFTNTPMSEVFTYLSDASGIQIYVKEKQLEEAGVPLDATVNKNLKQVRLSTGLELMLDELGLTYVEKDDLLLITTPEDADSVLEIRVYDCRDLLAMPGPGTPGYSAYPGMMPGMSSGYPGGYGTAPGAGDPGHGQYGPPVINPQPGGVPGYGSPSFGPPIGTPGPGSGGPGGYGIPSLEPGPDGAPPSGFAPGIPDGKAADEPAAGPATTPALPDSSGLPTIPGAIPATEPRAQIGGAPDGSDPNAARGGLGGGGLAPFGGGMMGAGGMMPGSMGGGMGGMGGGMAQQPMTDHDMRAMRLMNIITTAVDNQSWSEMGGPGTISEYNGLIVITQTDETHRKVEKVLDMLREAANLGGPRTNKVVR